MTRVKVFQHVAFVLLFIGGGLLGSREGQKILSTFTQALGLGTGLFTFEDGVMDQKPCPPPECTPGRAVDKYYWQGVLVYMGIPPSPFAVEALMQWQQILKSPFCWNPLLTARRIPNWRCPVGERTQHYADRFMGIRATAETLRLPPYAPIRAMLRQEEFDREGLQAALSVWFWGHPDNCHKRCQDLIWQWHWLWQEHGISELCPPLNCQYGTQVEPAFYATVFRLLDLPVHPFAIQALQMWAEQEQARACWNPLATTLDMGEQSCPYNKVGVKHYVNAKVGAYATARTMAIPYYEPFHYFLAGERWDEEDLQRAVAIWVTGNPKACTEPDHRSYCAYLLRRWRALWYQRTSFTWADLGLDGAPTPFPITPTPTPSPVPTQTPEPFSED